MKKQNELLSAAKGLVEEEKKMVKHIDARFSERCLVRCYDGEESYISNAIVWFDSDDEPVIAEPYVLQHADGDVCKHFYNRETEFDIVTIYCDDIEEEEKEMMIEDIKYREFCFIRCYDGDNSYVSSAIVWFDDNNEPVIAEPYVIRHADGEVYEHFFNRETEFEVLTIYGDDLEDCL